MYSGQLAYLRNTGTNTNPAYDLVNDDLYSLSSLNLYGMSPCFGDIDGDLDDDMIIGDSEGELFLFTNTAGPGNPANFVLSNPNYKSIDVGQFATPQMVDVNRDGKLDLLIGERSGNINYFENTGTTSVADFSSTPTNDLFGGIDVMVPCCTGHSTPHLTTDFNGDYILYVGSEFGGITVYDNIDGNINGTFNLIDSSYVGSLNTKIDVADITNDGKYELVFGESTGGISMLEYGTVISVEEEIGSNDEINVYPNPANSELIVDLSSIQNTVDVDIRINDMLGREVLILSSARDRDKQVINTSGFENGVYVLSVRSRTRSLSKRFIVQH